MFGRSTRTSYYLGLALATVALSLTACSAGPVEQDAANPAELYLQEVRPAAGREATALEAGHLACAMVYLNEDVSIITIQTESDGPHLWSPSALDEYRQAATTHLCPGRGSS